MYVTPIVMLDLGASNCAKVATENASVVSNPPSPEKTSVVETDAKKSYGEFDHLITVLVLVTYMHYN